MYRHVFLQQLVNNCRSGDTNSKRSLAIPICGTKTLSGMLRTMYLTSVSIILNLVKHIFYICIYLETYKHVLVNTRAPHLCSYRQLQRKSKKKPVWFMKPR